MKQQVWSSPKTAFEEFVPQVYCASCGDSGTTYMFNCNGGSGELYYYPNGKGSAIYENGVQKGWEGASHLGPVQSCPQSHTASADVFPLGFIDENNNGYEDGNEAVRVYLNISTWDDVVIPGVGTIIPGGSSITNWHATKDLDIDEWEIAKS